MTARTTVLDKHHPIAECTPTTELIRKRGFKPDANLEILSMSDLRRDHSHRNEPVVDGLLRRGETMNVIAAPKVGKTWLIHGLAHSISRGVEWLGFPTRKGRVLICDAELHTPELTERLFAVTENQEHPNIDALALRGKGMNLHDLCNYLLSEVQAGTYSLIVVDALYRFIPAGISENDNAAMMSLYNLLDLIASHTNAAIAVIHHTSKGDQSGKAVTDVGSGAGSIARAADTHLTIRPHEEDGMAVLQAVTRSFSPPEDRSIRWEYPHWTKAPWEPRLASLKTAGEEKQRRQDKETDDAIREALTERKQSVSELRGLTDYGQDRAVRSLKRLGATSKRLKSKRTGKITERFTLPVTT